MDEKIKDKVRQLLKIAADPNATSNEAQVAMAKARALMAKHDLSDDDIRAAKADAYAFRPAYEKPGSTPNKVIWHPVDRWLTIAIAKFTGCATVYDPKTGKHGMYGMESSLDLAQYMLQAFREAFESGWLNFKKYTMPRATQAQLIEARKSFTSGFCRAIKDRISRTEADEAKYNVGGTHVILVKQTSALCVAGQEGYEQANGRASSRAVNHASAYGNGYRTGEGANMGRGVAGTGRIAISQQ